MGDPRKTYAGVGDLMPLLAITIGGIYCATQPDSDEKENPQYWCFVKMTPVGAGLSLFGTLPSHFYARTPSWKIVSYSTLKLLLGVWFSLMVSAPDIYNETGESNYKPSEQRKDFLYWALITTGIHLLEIYSQFKAIDNYDRNFLNQLFIIPGRINKNTFGLFAGFPF